MTETEHKPAWLVAAVDQRLAELKQKAVPAMHLAGADFTLTTLTEPPKGASEADVERWDRGCDHCGTYVPGGLHPITAQATLHGMKVLIFGGCCEDCAVLR